MLPPLAQWTVADACAWLDEKCRGKLGSKKTEEYKALFVQHDVDGETLVDAGQDELLALGMASFGHRHYILKQLLPFRHSSSVEEGKGPWSDASSPTCFGNLGSYVSTLSSRAAGSGGSESAVSTTGSQAISSHGGSRLMVPQQASHPAPLFVSAPMAGGHGGYGGFAPAGVPGALAAAGGH
eukprot:CAMPEP_0174916714 /NCGR_PEP_ID=MMETSP1355-20121228/1993_1 /TAXON_ID=464990 /ORGANISM="Hemiselmis tepida, Strain CCMP443" /LENGTH=181 /DNA_ID=CAMNT_0016161743 /DNA_START=100 /DNA_END=642 /DNA_ORIENTATION=+